MAKRPTLLVLTSTFPEDENSAVPTFVWELSRRQKAFRVCVLAPGSRGRTRCEKKSGMLIVRFWYAPKWLGILHAPGGVLPNLSRRPWRAILVPLFVVQELVWCGYLLFRIRPGLIHAHWVLPQGFIAALWSRVSGVPFIMTAHGADVLSLKPLNWLKKRILELSRKTIFVSLSLRIAANAWAKNATNITVIPMGTEEKLFAPSSALEAKQKIVLYVGRLIERKKVDLILHGLRKLRDGEILADFWVAGEGPERERLESLAESLGLSANVKWLGWLNSEKLAQIYRRATIMVSPAVDEAFGLTFVEAALSGLPAIGVMGGGAQEIIEDGVTGFLLTTPSLEELVEKMREGLTLSAERANEMRRANLERVKPFTWEKISSRYREVIEQEMLSPTESLRFRVVHRANA